MRRALQRILVSALVMVTAPASASVAAQRLASGRAAQAAFELDRALAHCREGLAAGDATADEVWRLHVLCAEVSAAMGFNEAAERSFARALELRPSFELPAESSPKLLRPYLAAHEKLRGVRLSAVPSSAPSSQGRVRVEVRVEGDVEGMVAAASLWR